ncbi:MAG: DNA cytosine methyltransferase [Mesorhizobium sp.]
MARPTGAPAATGGERAREAAHEPLTYGSVCSGIEAATMAWHHLGWRPAFFSEIEAFPSAVLAHRYGSNMPGEPPAKNGVPNLGDFTTIGTDAGPVDLLVGGTPCQSFSVAGKRLGLDDPRGNLALEYLALAHRLRARWIVWENVPGVLSSVTDEEDGEGDLRSGLEGREPGDEWIEESDFATFLSFVRECGYGFAYAVLDAQHVRSAGYERAVPQRRRRVFLVGYRGDFRPAAAVLLEPESLRGDTPPRRETGQGVAPTLSARPSGGGGLGTDFDLDGGLIPSVANPLTARMGKGVNTTGDEGQTPIPMRAVASTLTRGAESSGRGGYAGRRQEDDENLVAHSLRAEGFDASEDGTGRGTPIIPVFSMQERMESLNPNAGPHGKGWSDEGVAFTLEARRRPQTVAFDMRGGDGGSMPEGPHDTANIRAASGGSSRSYVAFDARQSDTLYYGDKSGPIDATFPPISVSDGWAVRRLTPRECERLQGFPDDFTRIPWGNRDAADCPDGPRYKALGNSMAVNVMRWIGERIDIFEREVRPVFEKDARP